MNKSIVSKVWKVILEILMVIIGIIFMYPIIMVVINSFKTDAQIMQDAFKLPQILDFSNYIKAWEVMKFSRAFINTLVLTIGSISGIVFFGSMAGYKLSRTKTWYSKVIFYLTITPMLISFSSIMITLVKMAKLLHLMHSIQGLIVIYWGLLLPMTIFLYHGFVKTVPKELDEAAKIDGCGPYKTFFIVIFPLLKPITITIIVLNSMQIWNDFLLPLLTISGRDSTRTLQLSVYKFVGLYLTDYGLLLAGFVMSIIPITIFFFAMQKHIMEGVVAGSIKG